MQHWSLVEHVAPGRWRESLILTTCLSVFLSSLSLLGAAEEKPSGSIEIPPNLTASRLDDTGGPLAPWLTPTVGCTSVSLAAVSQLSGLRCDRGESLTDSHHLPVYSHQRYVEHFHKTQVGPTKKIVANKKLWCSTVVCRVCRVLAFQYSPTLSV